LSLPTDLEAKLSCPFDEAGLLPTRFWKSIQLALLSFLAKETRGFREVNQSERISNVVGMNN
jgi:hypothetical protein